VGCKPVTEAAQVTTKEHAYWARLAQPVNRAQLLFRQRPRPNASQFTRHVEDWTEPLGFGKWAAGPERKQALRVLWYNSTF